MGRVLVSPQRIYIPISLSLSAELKPSTNESMRGGPPEPVLGPLNTNFEEEWKLASTLILISGPIFYSQTIKPLPFLSQGRAQSLRHYPAMASFAWQSNKAIFFSFAHHSVSMFLFSTCGQRPSFSNTTSGPFHWTCFPKCLMFCSLISFKTLFKCLFCQPCMKSADYKIADSSALLSFYSFHFSPWTHHPLRLYIY